MAPRRAPPTPPFAARDAAQSMVARVLASNPGASLDELNAALAEASEDYNHRPQADLGGLSPMGTQRLFDADWQGADSAIRLDTTLPLDALAPARTLHDARLLLALLGQQGGVKATPKGNLPRTIVALFRERMTPHVLPGEFLFDDAERVRNEEDVWRLHLARVLLELAGLLKRRRGVIDRTHAGTRLGEPAHAGELLATLVRVHFRTLNLAYLDGMDEMPGFQYTVGYTLHRFAQLGADWQRPGELVEPVLLPSVRDELEADRFEHTPRLMLETRFLRPLAGFGLAEAREAERRADDVLTPVEYRKSGLFDRVVSVEVVSGGI